MTEFTQEEIDRCKATMLKPAPIEALRLVASGRVVVEMTADRKDLYIDEIDGRPLRDPGHADRKMLMSGAWPLFRAGMIDEFCRVTEEGEKFLKEQA